MSTSTITTVADAITEFGVDVHPHLERDELLPVHTGLQRQGDVIVIPAAMAGTRTPVPDATGKVPAAGVAVVRGENGGNTHLLLAAGDVRFDGRTPSAGDLCLGVLTVPAGATAYLAHPEHSYTGVGPGTYVLNRQREQADEIRMVAD